MGLQPFLKEEVPHQPKKTFMISSRAIDRIAKDLRALITNEMELRDSLDTQLQILLADIVEFPRSPSFS